MYYIYIGTIGEKFYVILQGAVGVYVKPVDLGGRHLSIDEEINTPITPAIIIKNSNEVSDQSHTHTHSQA